MTLVLHIRAYKARSQLLSFHIISLLGLQEKLGFTDKIMESQGFAQGRVKVPLAPQSLTLSWTYPRWDDYQQAAMVGRGTGCDGDKGPRG